METQFQNTTMMTHLIIMLCLVCRVSGIQVLEESLPASGKFPEFVKTVSPLTENPPVTQHDVNVFLKTAFSVGVSRTFDVGFNRSVAGRLTTAYLEGTRQRHRLECFRPRDCSEIQLCGTKSSGFYRIYPYGLEEGVLVACDLNTECGGWTLVQRRIDGSVNFNRNWGAYMSGFGNLRSDFWMGLNLLNQLTSLSQTELMVEMSDYNGNSASARYKHFYVSNEQSKCRLFVRGFSGSAGDGLSQHNGMMFSTPDIDNDISYTRHCADEYSAGWWYGKCANVNLNGEYATRLSADVDNFSNVMWFTWRKRQSLQWTEMKVRPAEFASQCLQEN